MKFFLNFVQISHDLVSCMQPLLPLHELLVKSFRIKGIFHDYQSITMLLKFIDTVNEELFIDARAIIKRVGIGGKADSVPIILLLTFLAFKFKLTHGLIWNNWQDLQIFFVVIKNFYFTKSNFFQVDTWDHQLWIEKLPMSFL